MLNTLFILQYSFLNGYLLHRLFLKEKASDLPEVLFSSLFLSWCLNSLVIYILARLFDIPFTKGTVVLISALITISIVLLGYFFHSNNSQSLEGPPLKRGRGSGGKA